MKRSVILLVLGAVIGGGVVWTLPKDDLKAATATGNDKFSMVTVQTSPGETEAVFVLDHLTGVMRGGFMGNNGTFTHQYTYSVAADFRVNPATPEPKYVIVSGEVNLRASGQAQPARGMLYVGELTSGAVIAYAFTMPSNRTPPVISKQSFFQFRESAN
jgi:hypothetical protein